ncbi:MAG TPA: hypothetical protein VGO62_06235, partial [Myxococcota bacterium]
MTTTSRTRTLAGALAGVATALAFHAGDARACGGPDVFSPTASIRISALPLASDTWEGADIAPFRFLDPFAIARVDDGDALAALAYGDDAPHALNATSTAALAGEGITAVAAALSRNDRPAADAAARALVDKILSLPRPLADKVAPALRTAVEVIELAPVLPGAGPRDVSIAIDLDGQHSSAADLTNPALMDAAAIHRARFVDAAQTLAQHPRSPRVPSLELAVLRNRISALPNGWPPLAHVDAATWQALLDDHDRWIARYPKHPLADLARLQKVRVLYLKGDSDGAW